MIYQRRWRGASNVQVSPLLAILCLLAAGCGDNQPLETMGLLEWQRIELAAESSEPIVAIKLREGARVEAGQVILQQDPRRAEAALDEAVAKQEQAQARLAELLRGPREEAIAEARAVLEAAESQRLNARKSLQRGKALFNDALISQNAVDDLQTRFDSALGAERAANAALAALLNGTTEEELQQARAVAAAALSRVNAATIALGNLAVKAPVAGLLDSLPYESGERPPVGAVVAVMLANSVPYARVYVPEPIRAKIQVGTEAVVHVDGIERAYKGRVRTISNEAAFTPYYSLTERDRGRLAYVAEVDLVDAGTTPPSAGVPVRVEFSTAAAP